MLQKDTESGQWRLNGRIVRLSVLEPITHELLKAAIAEFLALYFFVTFCCGCAMGVFAGETPNPMQIAACFGFMILAIAQFVGPLSGGHVNCVVSFALFIAGRISFLRFVLYFFAQMLGSLFGALTLWYIYGSKWDGPAGNFGANGWDPELFDEGQVFIAETLGTMLLIWTVLSTVDLPSNAGGSMGAFPIAMSVMVAHLFLIPIDGCSINPTRSFGPAVVARAADIGGHYLSQQHIIWLGPFFGAFVAAFVYEYGSLKPTSRFDRGVNMHDAMFADQQNAAKVNPTDDKKDYTNVEMFIDDSRAK